MTLIEWKPGFSHAIRKMDADHRYMIGLIHGLDEQLQSGEHQKFIIGILQELYSRAAKHFALEEAIMRECGYEEHEADHRRLLDRVTTWMSEYQTEPLDDDMANWLANWFCNHIRSDGECLRLPNDTPIESVRSQHTT